MDPIKIMARIILISIFFCTLVLVPSVNAQGTDCAEGKGGTGADCTINIGDRQKAGGIPGIPAVGNPNASPGSLVSNGLRIMYILGGLAVLVFMVWGAFDWITSGGDKEKLSGAQKKITNSLIGLALLALSLFIVSLAGQIAGIDPLKMGTLPTLGEQAPAKP